MITVEQAFERLLADVHPLETEKLAVEDAVLRVLSAPVAARRDQPGLPISAMDGYAVQSAAFGSDSSTQSFRQIARVAAGDPPVDIAASTDSCVRIFTGASVPPQFDQVIPQEQAHAEGDVIALQGIANPGGNIRPAGGDFRERQIVLDAQTVLAPKNIGLLAGAGHSHVMVHRAAKVHIISTGNEVIRAVNGPGDPHQTIDSGTPMLAALLSQAGAIVEIADIAADSASDVEKALRAAGDADVIITIGGASVGDHDHIHDVLKTMGARLDFWKIAMRPGKPLLASKLGRSHILGLPGNPASAFVTALLFARPLVDALMGRPAPFPQSVLLPVSADLPAGGPRAHYMRARLLDTGEGLIVDPADDQDSAKLSVLAACDGLLVRPVNCPPATKGDRLPFIPF